MLNPVTRGQLRWVAAGCAAGATALALGLAAADGAPAAPGRADLAIYRVENLPMSAALERWGLGPVGASHVKVKIKNFGTEPVTFERGQRVLTGRLLAGGGAIKASSPLTIAPDEQVSFEIAMQKPCPRGESQPSYKVTVDPDGHVSETTRANNDWEHKRPNPLFAPAGAAERVPLTVSAHFRNANPTRFDTIVLDLELRNAGTRPVWICETDAPVEVRGGNKKVDRDRPLPQQVLKPGETIRTSVDYPPFAIPSGQYALTVSIARLQAALDAELAPADDPDRSAPPPEPPKDVAIDLTVKG